MTIQQRILPYLPRKVRGKLVPPEWNFSAAEQRGILRAPRGVARGEASLFIGPVNSASQAFLFAQAVQDHTDFSARSLFQLPSGFSSERPAHLAVPKPVLWHSPSWSSRQSKEFLSPDGFTHFLIDSFTPIMGVKYRRNLVDEVHALQDAGKHVALLMHGSDIRIPALHRELEPFSPFTGSLEGLTDKLQRSTEEFHALADHLNLPEFVTTLDLLAYRPGATWLPILRDQRRWPLVTSFKAPRSRPLVVHVPSNPLLKGTAHIRQAMEQLESDGLITYRELSGVPTSQVRSVVADADIFIDQLQMGLHGVASLEAMSAGVPVVAEVGSRVRQVMRDMTGLEIPIMEATPQTVADQVLRLAQDASLRQSLAQDGLAYVEAAHSPRVPAEILGGWLGS